MLTHTKFQDVDKIICRCVQRRTPDLGHTCLQEQLTETYLKNLLPVRPKTALGLIKNKNGNCKAFCGTRKRNNR